MTHPIRILSHLPLPTAVRAGFDMAGYTAEGTP